MKFEDFTYRRPAMETFTAKFKELLAGFSQAADFASQSRYFASINDMRTEFMSMYNICHIRHTMDTADSFYEAENNFFDREMPNFEALSNLFYRALLESPFRSDLEARWGRQIFNIAEMSQRTFRPEILSDLQQENQLSSEYTKIKATARIEFEGQTYNLSSIYREEVAPDRSRRRAAAEAKWAFYTEHAEAIESLYDQLVETRHRIARKLGFDNFTGLGYARMQRSDYDAEMVAAFREQIAREVVPVATELYERQRRRLGLDRLLYYDEDFRFASGNAEPKGNPRWIISNAHRMYSDLSPETRSFFEYLDGSNLMDLETRPGKATGGYCTYIGTHRAPFIFSNFNGTSGDIDVLTHEAGHAFQVFSSRDHGINEYHWPTLEACEIHSMSMEFFTWPWMELFFAADTEKYKFAHLAGAIRFMPYGVAVDEFQHFVYENPGASPAQRNEAWKAIEEKYLPHRDYDGHPFLESGGFWQKQSHIFSVPFYYIDYVLAQVCALQFWQRDQCDHQAAWSDYLRLCQAGGSLSFLELVDLANLRSPFEAGSVAGVVKEVKAWLDQVDDTSF